MGRRNNNGAGDYRGLSRGATYRFDPHVARELEIHVAVRGLGGIEPATQRAIVEEALRLWFKKHPISVKERQAAELLMTPRGGR